MKRTVAAVAETVARMTAPLVKADYEGIVEPDADTNNVPDYWEGSSYAWFTDADQDGFDDSLTLPEGVAEGGVVAVTLTTTRTAALTWGGDGFSGGLLVRPCTNRTVRFRVPAGFDTTLALLPPTVATNSCWKARMRVAWDPGNARPFEGPRLSLADGAVLRLDPTVEGTRTYLAPGSNFAATSADNPETLILRHCIFIVGHGAYCTIHGGDVLTALYTNTAPPFIWRYRDANDVWHTTDQTGPTFSPAGWGLGSYLVECRETSTQTVAYVASDTEWVTSFTCQPSTTNIVGAGWSSSHNPTNALDHLPHVSTNITYFAQGCANTNLTYYLGFDHDKVKTRNLVLITTGETASDETDHCLGVVWEPNGQVDLFALLDSNHMVCKEYLSFKVGAASVGGSGNWNYGPQPDDLDPAIRSVELWHDDIATPLDRMWLVVNSTNTLARFTTWYAGNADISWTTNLPPPHASISFVDGEAQDPEDGAPNQWSPPDGINPLSYLHHDARFEMRTWIAGESGNQAAYAEDGSLISSSIAAGTADRHGPYDEDGDVRLNTNHRNHDVYPFIRALQLDGNPVFITGWDKWPEALNRPCLHEGSAVGMYIARRPILH
jgi:hypothetical protein